MDHSIEVPVATIRRAAELLIARLEEAVGPLVAVDHDYFWVIPPQRRMDLSEGPTVFTVGQLTESLDNVERLVEGSSPPLAYGLVWLSDVLRAVGETVIE